MIFPEFLVGPQFAEGDLVTFSFDDAELSLRLPVIPPSSDTIDRVCSLKHFKGIDTKDWPLNGDIHMHKLVVQSWVYEDDITHLDIATCFMTIHILEHRENEKDSFFSLNAETFKRYHLNNYIDDLSHYDPETRPDWPRPDNDFFAKPLNKKILDGFLIQYVLSSQDPYPQLFAFVPINKNFTLGILFCFRSLHYADRKNTYSEELLHKLKLDLFDEFLSYVQVEYSGETLAMIEKLKTQNNNN